MFEERIIQVGAFAGIASAPGSDVRIPDLLRRADIAMDHARSGRVARPVWFDAGMERALIAHGEIEQGIRFGLEHGQFVPFFEPQVDLTTGDDRRLRSAGAVESSAVGHDRARRLHPGRRGNRADRPPVRTGHQRSAARGRGLGSGDQHFGQHLADPSSPTAGSPSGSSGSWPKPVSRRAAGGRNHRKLAVRRHRSRADDRHQPQEPGHPPGARRFRHRLFLACRTCARCRSTSSRSTAASSRNLHAKRESMAIVRAVTTLASALVGAGVRRRDRERGRVRRGRRLGCAIGQGWYFGKPMPADAGARPARRTRARRGEAAPAASAAQRAESVTEQRS